MLSTIPLIRIASITKQMIVVVVVDKGHVVSHFQPPSDLPSCL